VAGDVVKLDGVLAGRGRGHVGFRCTLRDYYVEGENMCRALGVHPDVFLQRVRKALDIKEMSRVRRQKRESKRGPRETAANREFQNGKNLGCTGYFFKSGK
jgi:hypothetical protein